MAQLMSAWMKFGFDPETRFCFGGPKARRGSPRICGVRAERRRQSSEDESDERHPRRRPQFRHPAPFRRPATWRSRPSASPTNE